MNNNKTNLFGNLDKILEDANKENKEGENIIGQKRAEDTLMVVSGLQKDKYKERQELKSGTKKETVDRSKWMEEMDEFNKKVEKEKRLLDEMRIQVKEREEIASKFIATYEMKNVIKEQRLILTANMLNIHPWFLGYEGSVLDEDFKNPEGLPIHRYGIVLNGVKYPGSSEGYSPDPRLKYPAIRRKENERASKVIADIVATEEGRAYFQVNYKGALDNCPVVNYDKAIKDINDNYILIKEGSNKIIQVIGEEYTYDEGVVVEDVIIDRLYEGDALSNLYEILKDEISEGVEIAITRDSDYEKVVDCFNRQTLDKEGMKGLEISYEDNRYLIRKRVPLDLRDLQCASCGRYMRAKDTDKCPRCKTLMCTRCSNEEGYSCVKCGKIVEALE